MVSLYKTMSKVHSARAPSTMHFPSCRKLVAVASRMHRELGCGVFIMSSQMEGTLPQSSSRRGDALGSHKGAERGTEVSFINDLCVSMGTAWLQPVLLP
jgi:hypothetical protein